MPMTAVTPTEADLEARIDASIKEVFPGIADLRHQLRFKVQLGHNEVEIGTRNHAEGRADIIVFKNDKPLAVFELKREGLELTSDDEDQGRSYARLVGAPLFVISNGATTKIFTTHDGNPLGTTSLDAAELVRLVAAAASAAQSNVKDAIGVLLGTAFAQQAISAMTNAELDILTGSWVENLRFVRDFVVPRKATLQVIEALDSIGKRAVIVQGAPLTGKSSVLRQLCLRTDLAVTTDVLYLDGGSCNEGIFRRIATILSLELGWAADTDDARTWLRRLGNRNDRKLVICIDGPQLSNQVFKSEINELIARSSGPQLRLVIAVDENDLGRLIYSENQRDETILGRFSEKVVVENYDDEEFDEAQRTLIGLGGKFVHGAEYSNELRAPWVLRAMVAPRLTDSPEGLTAVLPPQLGPEFFEIADERFCKFEDARAELRRLAILFLNQLSGKRSAEDVLGSMHVFSVGDGLVKKNLVREDLALLAQSGFIRRGKSYGGSTIWISRIPELFALEVAGALSTKLIKHFARDSDEAIDWFLKVCSLMPIGDAIGAQAISIALDEMGGENTVYLINGLLERPPVRRTLAAGSRMAMLHPSAGIVNFSIDADGSLRLQAKGGTSSMKIEEDDGGGLEAIGDLEPWMILSQIRSFGISFVEKSSGKVFSLAGMLLKELGSSPIILRKPMQEMKGYHSHEIPDGEISCWSNGIAEPVTWTIAELLSSDGNAGLDREEWVRDAAASGSLPLLNRVGLALTHLSNTRDNSEWAGRMLAEVYEPARVAHPFFH